MGGSSGATKQAVFDGGWKRGRRCCSRVQDTVYIYQDALASENKV